MTAVPLRWRHVPASRAGFRSRKPVLLMLLVLMHEVLCPAIGLCRRSPQELLWHARLKLAHRQACDRQLAP